MSWFQFVGLLTEATAFLISRIGSAGLLIDMIGVAILFKTGLPSAGIRETAYVELFEPNMAERYDRWSRNALGLIMFGFFLQLVGNVT